MGFLRESISKKSICICSIRVYPRFICGQGLGGIEEAEMQKIEFRAMGCEMLAAVDRNSSAAACSLKQTPDWFEMWEQRLSRFRPESELNQVNRLNGQEVRISHVLFEAVAAALRLAHLSGGLVNPAVLGALEAAGYDKDFDAVLASQTETAEGPPEWPIPPQNLKEAVQLRRDPARIRLAPGVRLDLGGTGKGWAADRAARRLGKAGPALVDAGGDIAVSGARRHGKPWSIEVADPFDPDGRIDLIGLYHGGVATSGRYRRRWRKGGVWQHHIIDPRRGIPAQTDVLSASVIASSARIAEMAAKVVLIGGSEYGLAWLEQHPRLAGLIVLESGEVIPSRNWRRFRLEEEAPPAPIRGPAVELPFYRGEAAPGF
jgi:thiamine biosynthesis lipoprotein